MIAANSNHVGRLEFRVRAVIADQRRDYVISALLDHVADIVLRRAKEQVGWVNTAAHVASMTNEQAIRDWAVRYHV